MAILAYHTWKYKIFGDARSGFPPSNYTNGHTIIVSWESFENVIKINFIQNISACDVDINMQLTDGNVVLIINKATCT